MQALVQLAWFNMIPVAVGYRFFIFKIKEVGPTAHHVFGHVDPIYHEFGLRQLIELGLGAVVDLLLRPYVGLVLLYGGICIGNTNQNRFVVGYFEIHSATVYVLIVL